MEIHFDTYISLATLVAVLGLWGRFAVDKFKTELMWKEYCQRRGVHIDDRKKFSRFNRDHQEEE